MMRFSNILRKVMGRLTPAMTAIISGLIVAGFILSNEIYYQKDVDKVVLEKITRIAQTLEVPTGKIIGANSEELWIGVTNDLLEVVRGGSTYLVCDSSGNCGYLSGSGTTNYVAKFANSSTLTTSLIFDDGSKVSIGTTSPASLFELLSESTSPVFTITAATSTTTLDPYIAFRTGASPVTQGIVGIDYSDSNKLKLVKGSDISTSTGITIDSSGNVGIGTTDPGTNKLKVNGDFGISTDGSTTGNPRVGAFVDLSSGEAARFQFGDAANAFQISYGGRMQIYSYWGLELIGSRQSLVPPSFVTGAGNDPAVSIISPSADRNVLMIRGAASQAGDLQQWQNSAGTVLSVVNNAGNFGIGTTNPGSSLEVRGSTSDNTASALNVRNSGGTSLLYVRNDGGVGIGTTNPLAKLHAGTTVTDYSSYSFANTGAVITSVGAYQNSPRTNVLALMRTGSYGLVYAGLAAFDLSRWSVDAFNARTQLDIRLADTDTNTLTDVLSLRSNGNVGIGTTAPTSLLELSKSNTSPILTITSATSTTYSPQIQFRTGATPSTQYTIGVNIADNKLKLVPGPDISTSTGITIDSSGKVGIGTTTPTSLLSVGSTSGFQVDADGNLIKIRNINYSWPSAQGGANTYLKNDGSGNLSWVEVAGGVGGTGSANKVAFWIDANNLSFNDNFSWVTSTQRLGIGTSTPEAKIHIYTNDTTTSPLSSEQLIFPLYGWSYRRPITISNPNLDLTDFQVSFTIDTQSLISANKMRSDCGDIRITDSDGMTKLDYWLESGCNSTSTKIWTKIPFISASSTRTIYIYYGNANAESKSNGEATFLFFDDFDDNSFNERKWDSPGLGTTTEANQELSVKAGSMFKAVRGKISFQIGNGVITEGRYYYASDMEVWWLIGKAGTEVDWYDRVEISFGGFSTSVRVGYRQNTFYAQKQVNSSASTIQYFTRTPPSSYTFSQFVVTPTEMKFYEGGNLVGSWTHNVFSSSDNIKASISVTEGGQQYRDLIRVRKYAPSEPTATIGGEETPSPVSHIPFLIKQATGNIAMGTSTSNAKLYIQGISSDDEASALNVINLKGKPLFYIRNDGNIGVGTTTPSNTLEVYGKVLFATKSGNNIFYMDEDGKIGIGTTTPSQNLHVQGISYISDSLGIGTPSPSTKLDVVGDVSIGTSYFHSNGWERRVGWINTNVSTADTLYLYYGSSEQNYQGWRYEKRYKSTGDLVTEFGVNGSLKSSAGPLGGNITSIAVDSLYIYAVGERTYSGDIYNPDVGWRIEKRYKKDGNFVKEFGDFGIIDENPSSPANDKPYYMVLDSSYIYIVGYDNIDGSPRWRIEKRRKDTGALVPAFDGDGIIRGNFAGGATGIAIDSQHIYIVGTDESEATVRVRIEKRDKITGALVSSFGNNGVLRDTSPSASRYSMEIRVDSSYIYTSAVQGTFGNPIIFQKRDKVTGALISWFNNRGEVGKCSLGDSGDGKFEIDSSYIYIFCYNVINAYVALYIKLDKNTGGTVFEFMSATKRYPKDIVIDDAYMYLESWEQTYDYAGKTIEKRSLSTGATNISDYTFSSHEVTGTLLPLYITDSPLPSPWAIGTGAIFYNTGNVGIGVSNPSNILTIVQNSATDPIADQWLVYSSIRWKENIVPLTNALQKIRSLRPVYFDWKKEYGGKHDFGFIGEEIAKIIPEVVSFDVENPEYVQGIDYAKLTTLALAGIQQLDEKLNNIEVSEDGDTIIVRGKLGIGTTSPSFELDVSGSIRQTNATNCNLYADATGQIICEVSSLKYKTNIENITFDKEKFFSLNPVTFEFKKDLPFVIEGKQIGFIAEEVHKLFPELVRYRDGEPEGIKYETLPIYLYQVVKEHHKIISDLEIAINEFGKLIMNEGELSVFESESLWDQIKELIENLGIMLENGVLKFKKLIIENLFTKEIKTQKICLQDNEQNEEVCLTQKEIKELMREKNSQPQSQEGDLSDQKEKSRGSLECNEEDPKNCDKKSCEEIGGIWHDFGEFCEKEKTP